MKECVAGKIFEVEIETKSIDGFILQKISKSYEIILVKSYRYTSQWEDFLQNSGVTTETFCR